MLDYLDAGAARLGDTGTRSLTRVSGLIGLTDVRGVVFDRPDQDGGVGPYAQFLAPRTITVEGEVWAEDEPTAFSEFGTILQALEAMVSATGLLKYRIAGDVRDLQMTAELMGSVLPVLDSNDQGPFLRYQAQFWCSDPRGYSQNLQSTNIGAASSSGGIPTPIPTPIPSNQGVTGGSVVVSNAGNTYSWPTIYIAGPISGPVIVIGSSSIYFSTLVLAAGQTLTVDTRLRTATVDGANVIGSLRFADSVFAPLAPATDTTIAFYSLGGGTTGATNMTVAWRDAYTA